MDNEINSFSADKSPQEPKGAMIGTIIIVILLVLGGLYVLSNRRAEAPMPEMTEEEGMMENGGTMDGNETVVGDEGAQVEAEMEAEIRAMEAEMQSLEAEMGRF